MRSLEEQFQEIRKLAIISLFSDDDFMNTFVLKGGNALDLAYKLVSRSSIDIDVSMESDFKEDEINQVAERIENLLIKTFKEKNYHVFDFKFLKRPGKQKDETKEFWGGYRVEFKVATEETFKKFNENINELRKNSLVIGKDQKKTFTIDISKFEYCSLKEEKELDDLTIYVYTPLLVIYEKLRAICQQMDEYQEIVHSSKTSRAKDFFDIYIILENLVTLDDFYKPSNLNILKEVFEVKKVPLELLKKIESQREFHRDTFNVIKDTVYSSIKLESYDYYFDYVIEKVKLLEALWKE